MPKLPYRITALLLALLLAGCSAPAPLPAANADTPVTMAFATDLHFLSPALTDNGEEFTARMYNGDGKVTRYLNEITEAFVAELLAAPPDAVVLGGDLTMDGEKQSHTDLSQKLKALKQAGIPVLVIPGNHDTNNFMASSYQNNERTTVPSVSQKEFVKLYGDLGYRDALSRDSDSLSYIYPLRSDFWVLLLDVNESVGFNKISENTYTWLEQQLTAAREQGVTVVSVSHQNILTHNPDLTDRGYMIEDSQRLAALLEKYGVPLNLTGHIHLQHISRSPGGLTEISTSAMATNPNRYGVVTFDGDALGYAGKNIDVAGWARQTQNTDPNLLDFAAYSRQVFWDIAYTRCKAYLDDWGIVETDTAQMAAYYADINTEYFEGAKASRNLADPAFALWERYEKDSFYHNYILSILESAVEDYSTLKIPE